MEYVSAFAHELPARIFLALMDWPLADAPLFTEATDTFCRQARWHRGGVQSGGE